MNRYQCPFCGKLHETFNEAVMCHTDVLIKDVEELLEDDAAEQRNEAVSDGQQCPFCSGLGFVELRNGMYPCNACQGTGHC